MDQNTYVCRYSRTSTECTFFCSVHSTFDNPSWVCPISFQLVSLCFFVCSYFHPCSWWTNLHHLHHPPVSIFLGGMFTWYVYHSKSWVVYDIVLNHMMLVGFQFQVMYQTNLGTVFHLPSGKHTKKLLNMAIYSGFSH